VGTASVPTLPTGLSGAKITIFLLFSSLTGKQFKFLHSLSAWKPLLVIRKNAEAGLARECSGSQAARLCKNSFDGQENAIL
jgi:hypothetical protein